MLLDLVVDGIKAQLLLNHAALHRVQLLLHLLLLDSEPVSLAGPSLLRLVA